MNLKTINDCLDRHLDADSFWTAAVGSGIAGFLFGFFVLGAGQPPSIAVIVGAIMALIGASMGIIVQAFERVKSDK